jgi:hypothetical protein
MSLYRKGLGASPTNVIPFRDEIREKQEEVEQRIDDARFALDMFQAARTLRAAFKKRS